MCEKAKKFHSLGKHFNAHSTQILNQAINHVLLGAYESPGMNLSDEFGFTFAGITLSSRFRLSVIIHPYCRYQLSEETRSARI